MNAAQLENLCRKIAPGDIAGHSVYVGLASEMPEPLRPSPATWGYHGPSLDLAFRTWLSDSGRWLGRGVALAINDIDIRGSVADWAADDPDLGEGLYRTRILATVLHEIAHALSTKLDFRPLPQSVAGEIELSTLATTTKWVADSDESPWVPTGPAWLGHDLAYIRTLLHVIHRAYSLGIERLPDNLIFVSQNYSLSPLASYRRSLESEIESFASEFTFADLRTCRPTEAFVDLWKKDLHAWVENQPDELAVSEMVAALRPYINIAG